MRFNFFAEGFLSLSLRKAGLLKEKIATSVAEKNAERIRRMRMKKKLMVIIKWKDSVRIF